MEKKQALLLLQMIHDATQWLLELSDTEMKGLQSPENKSLRIFTEEECNSLTLSCRRFLLELEQQGIVSPILRERIIHHAMELQVKNIDLYVIEEITRIVLSRQPGGESALARMELLMAETDHLMVQ